MSPLRSSRRDVLIYWHRAAAGGGVNGTAEINVLQDVAYRSNKAGLRRERSKLRNEIARPPLKSA